MKTPRTFTVKMTALQAAQLGILRCKHCGYPENNHFSGGTRTCAHDKSCPGWTPVIRLPAP